MDNSGGPIKEAQGERDIFLVKMGMQGEENDYTSSHEVNSKWKLSLMVKIDVN